MKIKIFAQHYYPEEVSGAVLATELAESLVERGHQVSFVTCVPNYPPGRIFPGFKNKFYKVQIVNGVRIIRIWSYITNSKKIWRRIFQEISFSINALVGGLISGKADLLFSYSPPLILNLSAWVISIIWRIPWILRIEDLFPEAAIATGLIHHPVLIKILEIYARFFFQKASQISVISNNLRSLIIQKGVSPDKISVLPVWADPNQIQQVTKINSFFRENQLEGKFVIVYAGTLGYTSALEDFLHASCLLVKDTAIQILIIGEGVKKRQLELLVQDIPNIRFLPFQPKERYPEVLAVADLCLVSLNPDSASYSLPSKIFNIMAAGKPILALMPEQSDAARLIEEAGCGIVIPPDQIEQIVSTIKYLIQNPDLLSKMGGNGRRLLETSFSRNICIDRYEKLLINTLQKS